MKLEEFDFYLPEELIAQTPLLKRDTSKLLTINRKENTTVNLPSLTIQAIILKVTFKGDYK